MIKRLMSIFSKKEERFKSPMDVCAIPGDGPLLLCTTDKDTLAQIEEMGKGKRPQPPKPPEGPPCRTFKDTFLCGMIETEESKERTREWSKRTQNSKCV